MNDIITYFGILFGNIALLAGILHARNRYLAWRCRQARWRNAERANLQARLQSYCQRREEHPDWYYRHVEPEPYHPAVLDLVEEVVREQELREAIG